MFHVPCFKKEKGFTMLEVIVTIFILVVAVIVAYYAFYKIMVTTSMISSRLTAAYLAQEGIEIIRNIRDTNWLNSLEWDTGFWVCWSGCEADYTTGTGISGETSLRAYTGEPLNIDANQFYSYSGGTPTKFKRKITITTEGDNLLKVSVLIEWQERGEPYNFEAEEHLYKWY